MIRKIDYLYIFQAKLGKMSSNKPVKLLFCINDNKCDGKNNCAYCEKLVISGWFNGICKICREPTKFKYDGKCLKCKKLSST